MELELTVLTNRRALTADGLSLISRLPVVTQVLEWNESAEQDVLGDDFITFLPVNAQHFSAAKSLNRAMTALSSGCQVLSVGYPLYSALEPFIYRDPRELLSDFAEGSLRLSATTLNGYREKLDAFGSARAEVRKLVTFVGGLKERVKKRSLPVSLIHGHSTRPDSHSLAQAIGGFSVASPYCAAALDFDVIFRGDSTGVDMLVSPAASRRLLPDARARLKGRERIQKRAYLRMSEGPHCGRSTLNPAHPPNEPIPVQLASYGHTMHAIERRMTDAFGPCRTIVSETSQLPFPPVHPATR
jgi:hypothetical protein